MSTRVDTTFNRVRSRMKRDMPFAWLYETRDNFGGMTMRLLYWGQADSSGAPMIKLDLIGATAEQVFAEIDGIASSDTGMLGRLYAEHRAKTEADVIRTHITPTTNNNNKRSNSL